MRKKTKVQKVVKERVEKMKDEKGKLSWKKERDLKI